MMATEGPNEAAVDVSITDPSQKQSSPTLAGPQDAFPASGTTPAQNGPRDDVENKHVTDNVDELVNSADPSVSGGSDTETSKFRSADDKGHGRNSSAVNNKPKSFKSVSVNRTFLAPKGAAATSSSSRPESTGNSTSSTPTPSNVTPSASRLKLVAKSGTSLGGSTKTLSTNGKPAAVPDGNSVWNRNRPTPAPEPQQLSDRELMKLGIHMADRLGPESNDKKGWADIEDDEEWEPESIIWTDGTQNTLSQVDEPAKSPAAPEHASLHEPTTAPPKPRSPAPLEATPEAAPPVQPAARTDAPTMSRKGLVLKGAPEKPQLVAKPPPQTGPAKSPWGVLPTVDKISPVVMDLPNGQQPPTGARPPQPPDYPSMRNPLHPTKEIAADDFSRASWREAQSSNRELFNSQSGRLEPVPDRRNSRNEGQGRQVLQRPSQDHQGPAEPSVSFQTNRHSTHEMPHGRRRGSSNVSGGSGALANRLGRPSDAAYAPPPNDLLQNRSGSLGGGTESPMTARTFSPANNQQPTPRGQHIQPWRPSPTVAQAGPSPEANAAAPSASIEQELELQKKMMREKREMAMKRRQEEDAREEAARHERIRMKLEAMGPAPERKSAKKDEAKDKAVKQPNAHAESPSSFSLKSPSVTGPSPIPTAAKPDVPSPRDLKAPGPIDPDTATGRMPPPSSQAPPLHPPQSKGWSETTQPLWSSGPPGRNVWGAPGERPLGNGTFDSGLSQALLSQALPEPHSSMPGMQGRPLPIGHPRASQDPPVRLESSRLAPIGPPGRNREQPQAQASSNPWRHYDAAEDDRAKARARQASDEARMKELAEQGLGIDSMHPTMNETWKPVKLDEDGKRFKDGVQPSRIYSKPGAKPAGPPSWGPAGSSAPMRTHDHGHIDPREIAQPDYRHPSGPNGMRDDFSRQPSSGPTGGAVNVSPASQVRGSSRFFPTMSRDIRLEESQMPKPSRTPTPPPPTMEDHPVYEGNPGKPHVSLPKGPIVVKLPPPSSEAPVNSRSTAAAPARQTPTSFADAVAGPPTTRVASNTSTGRPSSQGYHGIPQRPHEIASQENWQDKINSLMGKKPSMGVPRSMNVDSLSRYPIDHSLSPQESATVSLPSLSSSCSTVSEVDLTTKEMAEECFEEQEMGSLPTVHLPSSVPEELWTKREINWNRLPPRYRVDTSTRENPRFYPEVAHDKVIYRIKLPGMPEFKSTPIAHSSRSSWDNNRTKSNASRQGSRGGSRHTSRGGSRGGREVSNDHSTSTRPNAARSSRGALRARSENWTRKGAAPAAT